MQFLNRQLQGILTNAFFFVFHDHPTGPRWKAPHGFVWRGGLRTTIDINQSDSTTIWTGTIFEIIKIVVFEFTNSFNIFQFASFSFELI